jgi:hypothetical protein
MSGGRSRRPAYRRVEAVARHGGRDLLGLVLRHHHHVEHSARRQQRLQSVSAVSVDWGPGGRIAEARGLAP